MVRDLRRTRVALGNGTKTMYATEVAPATKMSKKIVAARDLPAGHVLTEDDLALKSPGDGLPPYELERVVGRILRHPLNADGPLTFELLEERLPDPEPSRVFSGSGRHDD
jgi:N-acetylneuraminate synthase/sialic acid synthase